MLMMFIRIIMIIYQGDDHEPIFLLKFIKRFVYGHLLDSHIDHSARYSYLFDILFRNLIFFTLLLRNLNFFD